MTGNFHSLQQCFEGWLCRELSDSMSSQILSVKRNFPLFQQLFIWTNYNWVNEKKRHFWSEPSLLPQHRYTYKTKASKENKFRCLEASQLDFICPENRFIVRSVFVITHLHLTLWRFSELPGSCGVRTFSSHALCLQKPLPSNIRNSASLPVPRLNLKMFVLNLVFHYCSSRFVHM